jgi:hypothetical protein
MVSQKRVVPDPDKPAFCRVKLKNGGRAGDEQGFSPRIPITKTRFIAQVPATP